MGDADSITKTTYKDEWTGTTKSWSTPPQLHLRHDRTVTIGFLCGRRTHRP